MDGLMMIVLMDCTIPKDTTSQSDNSYEYSDTLYQDLVCSSCDSVVFWQPGGRWGTPL